MMSGDALVTDEYWAITGDTGQGTLMTFSPDPRKNEVAQPVVAEFEAQGYDPEGYTLYTYAAIQAWAQAAEKAGSTDLDAVIEALHGNQFETVLGPIGFDDKGDVEGAAYVMYEWDRRPVRREGQLSRLSSEQERPEPGPRGPALRFQRQAPALARRTRPPRLIKASELTWRHICRSPGRSRTSSHGRRSSPSATSSSTAW